MLKVIEHIAGSIRAEREFPEELFSEAMRTAENWEEEEEEA